MHDDHHDNIFDKDDTLDYLMYRECEKGGRKRQGDKGSGCLGLLILMAAPAGLLAAFGQIFFNP